MDNVTRISNELTEHRHKNKATGKLYKVESDEHRSEILAQDIQGKLEILSNQERVRADFNNTADVRQRVIDYFTACKCSGCFPSVLTLAVSGMGCSRRTLNAWMQAHPDHPTTEYLLQVKDLIADCLTSQSLSNNCNVIMSIFMLKNNHEFSDRVDISAVPNPTLTDQPSAASIAERYTNLTE